MIGMKRRAIMKKKIYQVLTAEILLAAAFGSVEAATLDTVYVDADRNAAVMAGGEVSRTTDMGPFGETNFSEIPANAISYTDQLVQKNYLPTRTFLNAVSNNPSVMVGGASTDNNVELQIRGLPFNTHDILLDGLPGMMMMENETTNWASRIDVITGPNAVVSGTGLQQSVSGTINFVPKKAEDKPNFDIIETYSEKHLFNHQLDVGRRFGKENRWGVRLNAERFAGYTTADREDMKGQDLYLNIDQRTASSKSNIFIGYEHSTHHGMPEILRMGNWGKGVSFIPDADKVQNNFMPSWSLMEHQKNVYMISHEQKLTKDLDFYIKAGYMKRNWPGYLDSKPVLLNDAGDYEYTISTANSKGKTTRRAMQTGLRYRAETGSVGHELNAGYGYMSQSTYSTVAAGESTKVSGNIYKPLDDSLFPRPDNPTGYYYLSGKINNTSLFLTDTITALDGDLKFLAGVRHTKIETRSYSSKGVFNTSNHYDKSATTPFFGVLYKAAPHTSVYASYAEALTTMGVVARNNGYLNEGEVMPPAKTKQYEFGVKWDFGKWGTTLDYFHIKQPVGLDAYTESGDKYYSVGGKTKSQGIEWNIFGKPCDRLTVTGGVMLLHAKYVRNADASKNGNRVYGTPRINATMALNYEMPVDGLSLYGRISYFGNSYAESANLIRVPSWTRLDLGVQYERKIMDIPMSFSVMAYNVTDKKYWSTTTTKWGENGLMLNPGRTFMISAAMHF